ncbi:hypothetical protein ACS3UN_10215 [Oscillospiraceae bacterium LTW-04]|nr:hypothetical protein RBH76_11965 [Oscillospiraceae bacterium MB24-C1]
MTNIQTRKTKPEDLPLIPIPPRGTSMRGSTLSAKEVVAFKKRFLSQFSDNERAIRRLEEEICRWESRAEKMTSSFSHAPSHRGEDRIQSAVDEIVELRNLLYDRLVDATELRRRIAQVISNVPEQRLQLLLEYRYIDGLTWEEVATALTCDYRWTLRLHDRALALLPELDGELGLF